MFAGLKVLDQRRETQGLDWEVWGERRWGHRIKTKKQTQSTSKKHPSGGVTQGATRQTEETRRQEQGCEVRWHARWVPERWSGEWQTGNLRQKGERRQQQQTTEKSRRRDKKKVLAAVRLRLTSSRVEEAPADVWQPSLIKPGDSRTKQRRSANTWSVWN